MKEYAEYDGYIVDLETGRRIPKIFGGNTWIADLKNGAVIGQSLADAVRTASANGSAVDLNDGANQSFGIIAVAGYTDGTHTISVEESKNNNTADPEAADAYAAVSPAVSQAIAAATPAVIVFNFRRSKRYARAVTTVATATTGAAYAVLLGSQKRMF